MKFIILNKYLIESLKKVSNLLTRNNIYPILENVLLKIENKKLLLISSNTEIEIKINIIKISSSKSGSTTISGKKILNICRGLSKECNLKIKLINNKLEIISNSSRYLLMTLSANDFPNLKILENQKIITISQNNLLKILHATYFSMAIQDLRHFLNGLLFEVKNQHLYAVATDSYRLAISKTPLPNISKKEQYSIILPRKGVLELIKLLNYSEEIVSIKISQNYFQIDINNLTFTSKIITEKFPDYTSIIPIRPKKKIVLKTIPFKEALSRVAILSNEQFRGVHIQNTQNKLSITTSNQHDEEAFETLEIIYTNTKMKMSINASYMIDILNVIKGHEICLLMNDSEYSLQIQTYDCDNNLPQAIYIMMPLKI